MKVLKHLYKHVCKKLDSKGLKKEIFRKSIHMLGALCPLLAYFTSSLTVIITLFVIMLIYIFSEVSRLKGKDIYIISNVVKIANREKDEKHFSLGPITLAIGIIIALYFFPLYIATISIFSLSFGDGIASLAGKIFGKKSFIFEGKTFAGSMSCILATFMAQVTFTQKLVLSLIIAFCTTMIELLPLKDFDNIAIPVLIAVLTQYLIECPIFML